MKIESHSLFRASNVGAPRNALAATLPAHGEVEAIRAVAKVGPGERGDQVDLSPQGVELARVEEEASESELRGVDGEPLSRDEESQVRELQDRDREVRAHEEAHKAAAGDLAIGGPTYDYETGPDGRDYAVGGEVQIALKPGRTPEESVRNAQRARRAALAPAEPSGQDRKVAAEAARMESEARAEALEEEGDATSGTQGAAAKGASPEGPQGESVAADQGPQLDLLRRDEAYRQVGAFADAAARASG